MINPLDTRKHLGLALAVIGTTEPMVVLDGTIVNVALTSIQRALHFSEADLAWVTNDQVATLTAVGAEAPATVAV